MIVPEAARRRDVFPCAVSPGDAESRAPFRPAAKLNPDGKNNYVYMETRGRGHLMGVTLGVLQNAERLVGEGDDMIFIDDESKPEIVGHRYGRLLLRRLELRRPRGRGAVRHLL